MRKETKSCSSDGVADEMLHYYSIVIVHGVTKYAR
jgi:hypothetical protein